MKPAKPIPVRDHITLRVIAAIAYMPNGCWEYRKNLVGHDGYKYPTVRWHENGQRLRFRAHRYIYAAQRGPIPEGLVIDHTCANKWCIRPDHLEAVTQAENMRRMGERQKTCKNGHPHIPENRNKQNNCTVCARAYQRNRKAAIARGEKYSSISSRYGLADPDLKISAAKICA